MNALRFGPALALLIAGPGLPQDAGVPSAPALDHVVLAVSDLDQASAHFLAHGFHLKEGRLHANHLLNRHVKFRDGSSIELMSIQGEPLDAMSGEYAALATSEEGGVFVGLRVERLMGPRDVAAALHLDSHERSSGPRRFLSFPARSPAAAVFFFAGPAPVQDPDSLVSHEPDVAGLAEVWVEGGSQLSELLERLGATRCSSARSPDGRTGERLALGKRSIVIVRPRSERPRVLGVVLWLRNAGGGTVWPHPTFWVQYRAEDR